MAAHNGQCGAARVHRPQVPYGFGIVELDGTPMLRIVTRLAGERIEPGRRVHLDGEQVPGPEGEPLLTWIFRT